MSFCKQCAIDIEDSAELCASCKQVVTETLRGPAAQAKRQPKLSYGVLVFPWLLSIVVSYFPWVYFFMGMDAGPTGRENIPLILIGLVLFQTLLCICAIPLLKKLGKQVTSILVIFSGIIVGIIVPSVVLSTYSIVHEIAKAIGLI